MNWQLPSARQQLGERAQMPAAFNRHPPDHRTGTTQEDDRPHSQSAINLPPT
jgi:hypothetical protein